MPAMGDDRLTTLIANVPADQTIFSLEFFPPKTQAGFNNLQSRLARMATALRPRFVTVTWGAGGSTAEKSLELAEVCQRQLGLTTVLHMTCTNMRKSMIDEALSACKELGVRNILCLRGDAPREEYKDDPATNGHAAEEDAEDEFTWAVDLVKYIRRKHGNHFCLGVAGYPEGHSDESTPEAGKQDVEHDLPYLCQKVEAGAEFIMTQLTYNLDAYSNYQQRLRDYEDSDGKKMFARIPIIPGVLPIQSYQVIKRISKLSHAKIPNAIAERIEEVKTDDDAVKKVGVDIVSELVEGIKALPQPPELARVVHFYTLNLEKSVAFIAERCGLISHGKETTSNESSDSDDVIPGSGKFVNGKGHHNTQPRFSRRRASSTNAQPHNRVILDSGSRSPHENGLVKHQTNDEKGAAQPASNPSKEHNLMISEGQGSLGREATWDDFPNGRWGPAHSPAYGEIDGYGPSLKVGPATARKFWGNPTCAKDITKLFKDHVLGQLHAVPWSDEVDHEGMSTSTLRAETVVIRKDLIAMIEKKDYWTLASQPAVDGVRSDDETFGWGPKGGFVFQKPFVEFFCSKQHWEEDLKSKLIRTPQEEVSWMKTDAEGVYESTETVLESRQLQGKPTSKRTPGTPNLNPVTWGVFAGREIITPTIIEPESFRVWGQEAFEIWSGWRRIYPRGSEEEKLLGDLRRNSVLVNCVGQDYVGEGGKTSLWNLLLS